MEGTQTFVGDTATIDYEFFSHFFKPREHRLSTARWDFRGPEAYHYTLLEDRANGLEPLVDFDYTRSPTITRPPASTIAADTTSAEHVEFNEGLVGFTWMSTSDAVDGDVIRSATQFHGVAGTDAVRSHTVTKTAKGDATRERDA